MTVDSNKIIKSLLLLFLVFAALVIAKKFIVPFAIGMVLALLFMPMCNWLQVRGVPKFVAVMLAVLVVLAVVSGVVAMLSWQVADLAQDAGQIKSKLKEMYDALTGFISDRLGVTQQKQEEMVQQQQSGASGHITAFIGSLGYTLVDCLLIVVYMAMMLFYRSHIKAFLLKIMPAERRAEMADILHQSAHVSQQYLAGLAKMIACLWVMYFIGFTAAGVKNPIFFAFLCGILEIVPFVGNLTGSFITVMVSAAQGAEVGTIIGIVLTYGTVQFLQGWVLEPLIVGPQVKINPLATIVVLVVGELMWGIPGMVLAIPLTGMLKIFFDHVPALKPYGFLIGEVDDGQPTLKERMKKIFAKVFKRTS